MDRIKESLLKAARIFCNSDKRYTEKSGSESGIKIYEAIKMLRSQNIFREY
jgi:hypothetical protein